MTPWTSPGKNIGVASCSLLQGILPTQGSNPGLLHSRQTLYRLSHQGSRKTPPSKWDLPCLQPLKFYFQLPPPNPCVPSMLCFPNTACPFSGSLVCFLFDVASPHTPFPSVPVFYCMKKPAGGASFIPSLMLFPGSLVVKTLSAVQMTQETWFDLGSGRSPGGRNGSPLQYSCQENPMDRGTRLATVPGVAKSQTWLGIHACACMLFPVCACQSLTCLVFFLSKELLFSSFCRAGCCLRISFFLLHFEW